MNAERNFPRDAEDALGQALRQLCQWPDTVDVIMSQNAQEGLVQALCTMLAGEDTGVA